jgi:hypothetical protein
MARPDLDYLDELGLRLRMVGMDGAQIGSILEETRDHLDTSGQDPHDAFGRPEEYAEALADAQRDALPARPMSLTRGDLFFSGAVQGIGFLLLIGGAAALGGGMEGVDLTAGHVAGLLVVTAGLLWPLWPAMRGYMARRRSIATPMAAVLAVVAVFLGLTLVWDEPVVMTIRPVPALLAGVVLLAVCWLRAWRLRDPVRRPTGGGSGQDARH